ncbi:uncharacterized protein LOC141849321 [Brevipalpus obovatus]|uniref:uncharacterized protein LOC141849321 n=1 Tax=Brevipalpus obovatus TaxID=246614 RepID=UPI003D9F545C
MGPRLLICLLPLLVPTCLSIINLVSAQNSNQGNDRPSSGGNDNLTSENERRYTLGIPEIISPEDGGEQSGKCPEKFEKCTTLSMRGRKVDSLFEMNCACDQECAAFDDCCEDSRWIGTRSKMDISCVTIDGLGAFYMVSSCPSSIVDQDQRDLCEKHDPANMDPMVSLPVTNMDKRLTYRNIYCASCNSDFNVTYWNIVLDCNKRANKSHLENVFFDEVNNELKLKVIENGKEIYEQCSATYKFPLGIETVLRKCRKTIKTCPPGTPTELVDMCSKFQAPRYHEHHNGQSMEFRNMYCAQCHNVSTSQLTCQPRAGRIGYNDGITGRNSNGSGKAHSQSFSVLLDIDLSSGNHVHRRTRCQKSYQIYDIFRKSCRDVFCGSKSYHQTLKRCTNIHGKNESATISSHNGFEDCAKIILQPEEFRHEKNKSIHLVNYNRTLLNGTFELHNRQAIVCADSISYEISLNKFSPNMGLITMIGLGVSIAALICHIIVFAFVSEVRNLSGHNLLCLCVALIMAYTSFILMQLKQVQQDRYMCTSIGLMILYFFLSSMAWMNVIALDIWRTLRMATIELRVFHGRQRVRFIFYSLYAWSFALFFTISAIGADMMADFLPEDYQPGFGRSGQCWFTHRKALIIFFAAPIGFIMFINLIAFILTALMLRKSAIETKSFNQPGSSNVDFKLYFKLLLLMGLTWISGFIASSADSIYLWYLFIILNTLQGLFIFIAFSFKRKVLATVTSAIGHFTSSLSGTSSSGTFAQSSSDLSR